MITIRQISAKKLFACRPDADRKKENRPWHIL